MFRQKTELPVIYQGSEKLQQRNFKKYSSAAATFPWGTENTDRFGQVSVQFGSPRAPRAGSPRTRRPAAPNRPDLWPVLRAPRRPAPRAGTRSRRKRRSSSKASPPFSSWIVVLLAQSTSNAAKPRRRVITSTRSPSAAPPWHRKWTACPRANSAGSNRGTAMRWAFNSPNAARSRAKFSSVASSARSTSLLNCAAP